MNREGGAAAGRQGDIAKGNDGIVGTIGTAFRDGKSAERALPGVANRKRQCIAASHRHRTERAGSVVRDCPALLHQDVG